MALLFVYAGCKNNSAPTNPLDSVVSLRTDSTQYKYSPQGSKVTILLQNYSPYSIYCSFVKGRAIMAIEFLVDTTWFVTGYIAFTDISHDSVYNHVIPANSTYRDTCSFFGPGIFRLSIGFEVAAESLVDESITSNSFQIMSP
jgi:hypothetical protein